MNDFQFFLVHVLILLHSQELMLFKKICFFSFVLFETILYCLKQYFDILALSEISLQTGLSFLPFQ